MTLARSMDLSQGFTLNDGNHLPAVGLGVFMIPPEDTVEVVLNALDVGYRMIDTAAAYGNEAAVGEAVQASGIPREDIVIATKLWNDDHGYDATLRAFEASIGRLGLSYIDLYIIHFPRPAMGLYSDSWRAMMRLQSEGAIRSIGVSNFSTEQIDELENLGCVPAVNQVEVHPYFRQQDLIAAHAERNVLTQAWSPLSRNQGALHDAVIGQIAEEVGRSPAQVILRWHLDRETQVIPKTERPRRMKENLDLDFQLPPDSHRRIEQHVREVGRCHPVPGSLFDVS